MISERGTISKGRLLSLLKKIANLSPATTNGGGGDLNANFLFPKSRRHTHAIGKLFVQLKRNSVV